jgi:hypothetical protein
VRAEYARLIGKLAAAVLVVLAVSCSSESTIVAPISPTSSPGATTTPTPPTGGSVSPGVLRFGRASFRLSGGATASESLGVLAPSPAYTPPPEADVNLTWADPAAGPGSLSISGPVTTGAQPTSEDLTLSVSAPSASGTVTAASTADECSIVVSIANPTAFVGTFTCAELSAGDDVTVGATGAFSATA